jgi:hypothetical protein
MPSRPPAFAATVALLVVALVLPIALVLVLGVSALLGAMGDVLGARVLGWIGLAVGVVWLVDLVCLVLMQAWGSLLDRPANDQESSPES